VLNLMEVIKSNSPQVWRAGLNNENPTNLEVSSSPTGLLHRRPVFEQISS